jgi:hypothetical protein
LTSPVGCNPPVLVHTSPTCHSCELMPLCAVPYWTTVSHQGLVENRFIHSIISLYTFMCHFPPCLFIMHAMTAESRPCVHVCDCAVSARFQQLHICHSKRQRSGQGSGLALYVPDIRPALVSS